MFQQKTSLILEISLNFEKASSIFQFMQVLSYILFPKIFAVILHDKQRWSRGHKARGQSQGHKKKFRDQGQPFLEQTLSRHRTGMLEAKAKD